MLNKLLTLMIGSLAGFAIFNRTETGQRAIVAATAAAENTAEALGVTDTTTQAEKNLKAFLRMIRVAEGTAGVDGYRMLFGGGLFFSYDDHPRQKITRMSNGTPITSTAAGAYQFLARTWDVLRVRLALPDFSPDNQDKAAIELIREKGALADVQAGRFDVAVNKVRAIWASLPGAGYGQPEKNIATLRNAYQAAGGVIA